MSTPLTSPPRAGWMAGRAGLMVHWIAPGPKALHGPRLTDLNAAVDRFDIERFMEGFLDTGASWLIFTVGQNTGCYASPNSILDRKLPGRTPRRDLVLEIAGAVKKAGKSFIAYLPCEVRGQSEEIHRGFDWEVKDQSPQYAFQDAYLPFVEEYSLKFGKLCDGWWFDGCYPWDAFPNHLMQWDRWYSAARAGNPDSAISFNDGCFCVGNDAPVHNGQDFLSGEVEVLREGAVRVGREIDAPLYNPQWQYAPGTNCLLHALVPTDCLWWHGFEDPSWVAGHRFRALEQSSAGEFETPAYRDDELQTTLTSIHNKNGAVTFNIAVSQEGFLNPKSVAQLNRCLSP